MREIKFRTWDKERNEMYEVDVLHFHRQLIEVDSETDHQTTSIEPYELMQYTGLKDIKGKDIYHGDLCLYDRNINERLDKKVFVVEYQDGAFFIDSDYERVYLHDIKQTQEEVEVIGNIHENPELLGDSQ